MVHTRAGRREGQTLSHIRPPSSHRAAMYTPQGSWRFLEPEVVKGSVKIRKQPIRTRYLFHVTDHQPIRDEYFKSSNGPYLNGKLVTRILSDTFWNFDDYLKINILFQGNPTAPLS
eukprot:sb/3476675/